VREIERHMLIDGELVGSARGRHFVTVNPATEEPIGAVADGDATDMERAIAAARQAFDETEWSTNRAMRKLCLQQLYDALKGEAEVWRPEIVADVGTPIQLTYGPQLDGAIEGEVGSALRLMDSYEFEMDRGIVDGFTGPIRRTVVKEPIGVVGSIVPWNFPMTLTLVKLAAVIATGCTTVVKPAPDTPLYATRLGRVISEKTDIPPGVVNIVTASDHLVGETLAASPQVDMMSFTGSAATGKRVMEVASRNVTKVFLELGGKSANIVLDDADLDAALPGTTFTCMHAGQGCALPTRLLVPRSRYAECVERLVAIWSSVPCGDPTDMATVVGPLINARQHERVLGYIETGKAEGARLVVGGGRPDGFPKGCYVEPTLFVDVNNSMRIAREEIFGPVLVVIPYKDDDDAVRIANDSHYGLSGAVQSTDPGRAAAVARRVRAGMIWVNGASALTCDTPFGGYKHSGIGRQWGHEGFDELMELKSICEPA